MKHIKGIVVTTALASLLAGCYGQFSLTRKFYGWNGSVTKNAFANSAVMIVLAPVYSITALVDVLVFNPIEVFSGDNPLAANETGALEIDGHRYTFRSLPGEQVEVHLDGQPAIRYQRAEGGFMVHDLRGGPDRFVSDPEAHAKIVKTRSVF
ncbi:MAG: DUF3332 domain-containing protein [Myxococcales bacterium]|nr:DUF3332 domain-containing protein [Myxococcales bacterium]